MGLANIARQGDRVAILKALRDRLADDLDNAEEPRDVAALALRLSDVLAQIDAMPTSEKVSRADEIADRRAARRRAGAKGSARAAGSQ